MLSHRSRLVSNDFAFSSSPTASFALHVGRLETFIAERTSRCLAFIPQKRALTPPKTYRWWPYSKESTSAAHEIQSRTRPDLTGKIALESREKFGRWSLGQALAEAHYIFLTNYKAPA